MCLYYDSKTAARTEAQVHPSSIKGRQTTALLTTRTEPLGTSQVYLAPTWASTQLIQHTLLQWLGVPEAGAPAGAAWPRAAARPARRGTRPRTHPQPARPRRAAPAPPGPSAAAGRLAAPLQPPVKAAAMHSLSCPPVAEQPVRAPKAVPEDAQETPNFNMGGLAAANPALSKVLSCRAMWRTSSGARTAATAASPGFALTWPATGSAARNSFSASATTCAPWEKPGDMVCMQHHPNGRVSSCPASWVEQKSPTLQG